LPADSKKNPMSEFVQTYGDTRNCQFWAFLGGGRNRISSVDENSHCGIFHPYIPFSGHRKCGEQAACERQKNEGADSMCQRTLAVIVLCASIQGASTTPGVAQDKKPNIVVIWGDDIGHDIISV
jgi:hypothetical protein